jgi:mannose-6-phosphate isomerase-like protein (cupin superfamily)
MGEPAEQQRGRLRPQAAICTNDLTLPADRVVWAVRNERTQRRPPMMNDAKTTIAQPAAVNPPGKLAYATPTTAPLVAGRRSFFKYRDLGVTAASSGKMRAQVTIGADGMTQPTGWHYHVCEGQFVYMLSGWVDLEFEDGQKLRIQSGESLYIPGGLRHNETAASKDLELLEISVPADMGTVACEPPEGRSGRA